MGSLPNDLHVRKWVSQLLGHVSFGLESIESREVISESIEVIDSIRLVSIKVTVLPLKCLLPCVISCLLLGRTLAP